MFEKIDYWAKPEIVEKKNSNEKLIKDSSIKIKDKVKMTARINAVSDLIEMPGKGVQIRVITQKAFTSTDFIAMVSEFEDIKELNIAIYRMNQKNIAILKSLFDQMEFELNIVLSSFFRTSKRAEVWHDYLRDWVKTHKIANMAYCHNHAKIAAIRTKNNYYVIEGSENMSDNARIEQYVVDNDKLIYDFHSTWIKELIHGIQCRT